MFEKKIYKRLTRFTSFFLRKKKFFNKFKLFYYINNKQFLNKKKMKFINKFQQDSFSQKFYNYNLKNTNKKYFQLNKNLNFRTNYLKYLNRLNIEKNSKFINYYLCLIIHFRYKSLKRSERKKNKTEKKEKM